MERKALRIFLVLALLSISGVVIVQVYWFQQAFSVEEKKFDAQVTLALASVHKRVLQYKQVDGSVLNPVQKISAGYFQVYIAEEIAPSVLKELLKQEFSRHQIDQDFELGLYNCLSEDITYQQFVCIRSDCDPLQLASFPFASVGLENNYFGVYFPSKYKGLLSNLHIWLFSSSVIFIVILFFAYSLFFILKQKKLSEVQADFIKNMTHEFKTPISTVAISSKVLMDGNATNSPDRLATYAGIIYRENGRLESQVEKVLQLLTVNKSSQKLQFEEVDIVELIQELVESFQTTYQEIGLEISFSLPEKNITLWVDKLHFSNIIHNLLDNAVKYRSEANPKIQIGIDQLDKKTVISVEDNGLGISPEHQKKVFGKFYRVSTGDIHNVKGFGLGLSYVKKMVKAHGGKVFLKSELGKGSAFILTFNKKP